MSAVTGVAAEEAPANGHAARRAATEIACATLVASSAETATHSEEVDLIADGICRHLGVGGSERDDVLTAARLHDIGKVALSAQILEKPAELDEWERAAIRRHTIIGERIVAAVPELTPVARLIRHSHEHWDGSGYPDGLAGGEIPLGSRIVFCADAFHAIRCDRPYRCGRPAGAALREIRANAGRQFDPDVVAALSALAAESRLVARRPGLTRRSSRLAALLMILACGAGGSALARSGLFEEGGPAAPVPVAAGPVAPAAPEPPFGVPLFLVPAGEAAPRLLAPPPWVDARPEPRGAAAGEAEPRPDGGGQAVEGGRTAAAAESPDGGGSTPPATEAPSAPTAPGGKSAPPSKDDGAEGGSSAPAAGAPAPAPSSGGKTVSGDKTTASEPAPAPVEPVAPVPTSSPEPVISEPLGGKPPAPAKGS